MKPKYLTLSYNPLITLVVFIIVLVYIIIKTSSCTSVDKNKSIPNKLVKKELVKGPITLNYVDTTEDGKPYYRVYLPDDSTILEAMYPEEISQGLLNGEWRYSE